MYERVYGAEYKEGMDIKDIAKEVRKMLKAEMPDFKFAVRIDRFAGGQSLNIGIKDVPDGFRFAQENPKEFEREYRPIVWTDELRDAQEKARAIGLRFNYDGSEIQVDYFDVNYYCTAFVEFQSAAYYKQRAEECKLMDKEAA